MIQNTKERRHLTAEEREFLAKFARLEVSMEQLCEHLHGMLEVNFGPTERRLISYFLLPEPGVRVTKDDIRCVLDKQWKGEISERELSEWASMLMLNEAYDWSGPDEDEIADTLNELSMTAHEDE
jgi:hypothetical protein